MHCALQRTRNNSQKALEKKSSFLRKSSGVNESRTLPEECGQLSFVCKNSDQRLAFLAFLSIEFDGNWKIVALPLQCHHTDNLESEKHLNMEKVDAVCLIPLTPLEDEQQDLRAQHPAVSPELERCVSASDGGESSLAGTNESNNPSSQNGLAGSNSEICVDKSRVDTAMKKNSKKKAKKRGKQRKKLADDTCVELETSSEDPLNSKPTAESSTLGAYHTDESMSCPTAEPSSMDDGKNGMTSLGMGGSDCCSDIPEISSTFVDDMHSSDDLLSSSILNYTSEDHLDSSESRMVSAHDPVSSEEEPCCQHTSGDDASASFAVNETDSGGIDSISVSWNGDIGTDIDESSMKSGAVISSEEGLLCHMNCVSAPLNSPNNERTSSQFCNVGGMQPITSSKKGKQVKKVPRSSSVCRTGMKKENNHSVWQKVHKNDSAESNTDLKKENTETDVNSNSGIVSDKHSDNVPPSISKTEGKILPKTKASSKLKRKNIPGARQETSCYTRKGSYTLKPSSSDTVNGLHQSQKSIISTDINQEDDCSSAPSTAEGTTLYVDTDDLNSSDCIGVEETAEATCSYVDTDDLHQSDPVLDGFVGKAIEKCSELSLESDGALDQSKYAPLDLIHSHDHQISEVTKRVSSEICRPENGSISALQKWIPIGVKEPTPAASVISESSSLSEVDEFGISGCDIESTKDLVSASSGIPSSSPLLKVDDDMIVNSRNQISTGHDGKLGVENNAWQLSRCNSSCLEDIEEAINDVCRIQMASEAVSLKSGFPIAEFERLLYPAAPVICQSFKLPNCMHCVESDGGASLCTHTLPNISLGSLWKWYEKHGSYGLEVRTDGCENSKRFGVDCHDHRAYFVPSLSAVQLFVPLSNKTKWSGDPYLIFEYFELEQPPQRRPLFEKIKELVGGDAQCGAYGDPTSLNFLHLHDLHPRSWYAVAWYPIYKIPDGNLRAAFLTYHSLCHMVRRTTTSDPTESCIVSPVVGLQSYNAQGEGWFEVRQAWGEEGSEIVGSRLRSMEKTAALMSKATVHKGSLETTNRHPDYDFFLSRRR